MLPFRFLVEVNMLHVFSFKYTHLVLDDRQHNWKLKHVEIMTRFHYGGPFLIETSPLICRANDGTSVIKDGGDLRQEKVNKTFLMNRKK